MSSKDIDNTYSHSIQAGKLNILEHFWNHSDDNIFIMVLKGNDFIIEDFNPAQIRTFTFRESFIGQKLRDLIDAETYLTVTERYYKCLNENTPYTYDESHIIDGATRHWNTMIIPVLDSADGKTRIFGISREMTILINAKNALSNLNNELEQIITARTEALQKSNLQLTQQTAILEKQAYSDPLTHIGNRRYFFKHVNTKIKHSSKYNTPLSLIYLDLDYFKKINDTYGHLAGDCILKELATRITGYISKNDLFARFGGEEFVILCLDTNAENAKVKAVAILDIISSDPFIYESTALTVTSSIGVATTDPTIEDVDINLLIRNADTALYNAKSSGKNRVEQF